MVIYGNYELSEEQERIRKKIMKENCVETDFQIGLDCSAPSWVVKGHTTIRFGYAKDILVAVHRHILTFDKSIVLWEIQHEKNTISASGGTYVRSDFKTADDLSKHLESLTPAAGTTPLHDVIKEAVGRYVDRLREDPTIKPLTLIIVSDGANSGNNEELGDIMARFASEINAITGDDPRKKIGVQFVVLKEGNQELKEKMKALVEGFSYTRADGSVVGTSIVDQTSDDEILDFGGIKSPLCAMKILGGSRKCNEDLHDFIKSLRKIPKAEQSEQV